MPSSSTGFWVARTRNGAGIGRVSPSTLTWRSCIASSSADCVRGVARLISSTSRTLVKIGPGMKRKAPSARTLEPVTSDGRRSGVPCTRPKLSPSARANERASSVLPTPGTSSSSACPSARRDTTMRRRAGSPPTTARATCSLKLRHRRAPAWASVIGSPNNASAEDTHLSLFSFSSWPVSRFPSSLRTTISPTTVWSSWSGASPCPATSHRRGQWPSSTP